MLVRLKRELDVFQKDDRLVACVLVEPDLADTEYARCVEEFGNHRDDLPRKTDVL